MSFLEGVRVKTRPEEKTNNGQIDLVVELSKVIYIFEFKLDKNSKVALEQIKPKGYMQKYLQANKQLVLVGVNFSSKLRNIADYHNKALSADGREIKLPQE